MELVHATGVWYRGAGFLLRGPSGSGKSDLALRLIHAGGCLVADDYIWVKAEAARLYATAPESIRDRLEVRGVGIVRVPARRVAAIAALIELVGREAITRLPEVETESVGGVALPVYRLDPFAASAVAKVATIAEVCKTPRQ